MNFRIRPNNIDDEIPISEFEDYFNYLNKFNKNENKDLWTFFEKDFFHDGQIKELQFSNNLQNLSFKVSCPNIKRNNGNSSAYIKPIWFTCRFEGVVIFQLEVQKLDDINDPLSENETKVLFLESEINTMKDELEKYKSLYDNDFISLIIKTLPVERNFSLVFQSLKVEPDEPLAFELIKQDKSFDVPLVNIKL